jgi:hypothetical protein
MTTIESQDEQTRKHQDREAYTTLAELPSTSIAIPTNEVAKNERPQQPMANGKGIKSRFTEILADEPVIGGHHPSPVEPKVFENQVNHASSSQKKNSPQLETAVAVGLSGPASTTPSRKPNQPTEPKVEFVVQAIHPTVRRMVREASSRQEASRLNNLDEQDVDETASSAMSRKNTDTSASNLPLPGQFPRALGP